MHIIIYAFIIYSFLIYTKLTLSEYVLNYNRFPDGIKIKSTRGFRIHPLRNSLIHLLNR